jgi:hypothetical protein
MRRSEGQTSKVTRKAQFGRARAHGRNPYPTLAASDWDGDRGMASYISRSAAREVNRRTGLFCSAPFCRDVSGLLSKTITCEVLSPSPPDLTIHAPFPVASVLVFELSQLLDVSAFHLTRTSPST